jgi:hypothetical protein
MYGQILQEIDARRKQIIADLRKRRRSAVG